MNRPKQAWFVRVHPKTRVAPASRRCGLRVLGCTLSADLKRVLRLLIGSALCGAWAASVYPAPSASSQPGKTTGAPTTQPASPDDEPTLADQISRHRAVILSNPLDSDARVRLTDLRVRERQQRREALDGLAAGLQAYLDGKRLGVKVGLTKAVRSPFVPGLTEAELRLPLAEILESGRRIQQSGPCVLCGDTNEVDCNACEGKGLKTCSLCKGWGLRRDRDGKRSSPLARAIMCDQCKGAGALPCAQCKGRGVVSCRKCAMVKAQNAASETGPGPDQSKAIEKLIALARYLRDGGVDLYSPRALEPSPGMPR